MRIFYFLYGQYSSPISISADINIPTDRYNGMSKEAIIKTCWRSMQEGLTKEDIIDVLAVRVDDNLANWLINTSNAVVNIIPMSAMDEYAHPYAEFCEFRPNNFIEQYKYIISTIEQNPNELYYVCLDDYLHNKHAITSMKQFMSQNQDVFFVPYEYLEHYVMTKHQIEVHPTNQGYFKKAISATPTMAAYGYTWLRFKYEILRASVFADDGWTFKAFTQCLAVTPMPAWTTHLQNGCISPFVKWNTVIDSYKDKI